MNQQVCDTERLNAFVQGTLDANAERDLTSHLDECESCGQTLEGKVAEAAAWREASDLLGGGDAISDVDSCRDREEDRSAQIQQVLSQLAPTDDPDSLGRIGGYEVTGVIGSGGMGVVLKAHDRTLDRVVSVKVMAPHLAASGSARQRFAREAKAAAAVMHPNVIAIHGVSSDQSLPFLVMPYVPGSSLQKRIDSDGPLPTVHILRIGSQIAAGLAAAHGQGLVHRDIKPANILLEQGVERVTITDFGLARAVDDASMTRSGVIAGTPQYMSPEQARGEPIDHRSDLFSLGSLLYAMCTGHSPFRAETSFGVLHRITHDSPSPIRDLNADIPEWLEVIVMKLLSKPREDRFSSAGQVAELLEDCLAHHQRPTSEPLPEGLEQLKPYTELPQVSSSGNRVLKGLLALGFGAFLTIAATIVYLETGKGTIRIETNSEVPISIVLRKGDEILDVLTLTHLGVEIRLRAGNYLIEVNGDKTDVTIVGDQVRLSRGEEWLATVTVNASKRSNVDTETEPEAPSLQAQVASLQRQVEAARASVLESEAAKESALEIARSVTTRQELQTRKASQAVAAADASIEAAERRVSSAKYIQVVSEEEMERLQALYGQAKAENDNSSGSSKALEQLESQLQAAKTKTAASRTKIQVAVDDLEVRQNHRKSIALDMKIETAKAETELAKAEGVLVKAESDIRVKKMNLEIAAEELRELQSVAEKFSDPSDSVGAPADDLETTANSKAIAEFLANERPGGNADIQVVGNQIVIRGEKSEIESARKQFDKLDSTNLDPEGTNRFGIPHVARLANADGESWEMAFVSFVPS